MANQTDKKPVLVICNSPEEYISADEGGAIYTVPIDTFMKSPQEGLEDSELVSDVEVTPIYKQIYATSLEAMKERGITIYFVNSQIFNKIIKAKDEQKIISTLKAFQ